MAPVANAGTKLRLSTAGGFAPRWRRDGKELFYLEPGNRLMRVPMTLGARFEAGAPVPLFRVAAAVAFTRRTWYTAFDVAPDGQRFLLNLIVDDAASTPPTVVLNWNAGLKN